MATPKRDDSLATYTWEGKDKSGKIVRGEMRAATERSCVPRCAGRAFWFQRVKKQSFRGGGKVTDKDITLFTRQLATMMKSGVPLLQSFDIVGKGASNPAVGKLLSRHQDGSRNRLGAQPGLPQVPAVLRHPLLQPGRSR